MSRGMWVQNATTNDGLNGGFQTIRMKKSPKAGGSMGRYGRAATCKGNYQFRTSAT